MNNLDSKIDEILFNFAKRIENMQAGKTYGVESEKQQLKQLFKEMAFEAYKETEKDGYLPIMTPYKAIDKMLDNLNNNILGD